MTAQLVRQLRVRAGHLLRLRRSVQLEGALSDQLAQPGGLGVAGRHRVGRQVAARRGTGRTRTRRPGPPRSPTADGCRRCSASISAADRRCAHRAARAASRPGPPATTAPGPRRARRPGRRRAGWRSARCRWRRAGGPRVGREVREGVGALGVVRVARRGDLDGHVVPAEQGDEPVELGPRAAATPMALTPGDPGRVPARERPPDGPLAAAGEHEPLPGGRRRQLLEPVVGGALLSRCAGAPPRSRGTGRGTRRRRGRARAGATPAGPGRPSAGPAPAVPGSRGPSPGGADDRPGRAGAARRRTPWAARPPWPPARTGPRRTARRGR